MINFYYLYILAIYQEINQFFSPLHPIREKILILKCHFFLYYLKYDNLPKIFILAIILFQLIYSNLVDHFNFLGMLIILKESM